jgi:biotin carboxyl carrier protein
VARGDVLIIVEAMKMLNELRCRVPVGEVSAVLFEVKDRVEIGDILIELTEPA